MKEMKKLKKDYDETEIPSELEDVVKASIRRAKASQKKRPFLKQWTIGAAAAAALFMVVSMSVHLLHRQWQMFHFLERLWMYLPHNN